MLELSFKFYKCIYSLQLIVFRDLNITLDPKEKKGGVCGREPMHKEVDNLIQIWDLLDFNPKKGQYTWINNRVGSSHISARLDQFLVQSPFLLAKKNHLLKHTTHSYLRS